MVNKQSLLFLTLTSLILVLSIYYVTMPNELLLTNNSDYSKTSEVNNNKDNNIIVSESSTIDVMRNLLDEERIETISKLNKKLSDKSLTVTEKNDCLEEIKNISKIESLEEAIETKIKNEFKLDSFVKINDDVVDVVINSADHNNELVVKIMSSVQKEFKNNMYISVSFKE